jgi:hypothetical protein
MRILKLSLLPFLLVSITSCNNKKNKTIVQQEKVLEVTKLELNNGEKWQVNSEMMPHIKASENLLSVYSRKADYKVLATAFKENNNKLISSCTMKGKPHDELHKWLLPQLELVTQLEESQSKEEAEKHVREMQQSFKTFNAYFE